MDFVRRLIDVMLFKRGPEDMPGNQSTLAASAAVYCILLFAQAVQIYAPAPSAAQALLATVLLGLYVSVILRLRKVSNRFPQTATTMFSVGALVALVVIPPTRAMAPYWQAVSRASDPENVPMPPVLMLLVFVLLALWKLAVDSHVYRRALGSTVALGIGAAIGFEVLQIIVFGGLG